MKSFFRKTLGELAVSVTVHLVTPSIAAKTGSLIAVAVTAFYLLIPTNQSENLHTDALVNQHEEMLKLLDQMLVEEGKTTSPGVPDRTRMLY